MKGALQGAFLFSADNDRGKLMKFYTGMLKLLLLACLLLIGRSALATPVRCSPGYVDSTCITALVGAPIPPPVCATAPGWTTITAAKWIGSGYTQPQCSYQAPPVCSSAPGYITVAPASWNGSSWSNPSCSYTPPPTCSSGELESVAPTWNGSAWVGLGCTPALPSGFTLAPDGRPYAMLIGYCGEVSQTTILHVVHYTDSCTPSMAGAVRVNQAGTIDNGNGTLDYWRTPSSFTTTSPQTYRNAPGPVGTIVQTVNISFGVILYNPDDTGTDPTSAYEGPVGGGSAEDWVYACPVAYPTINFSTVAAYGESNPTLIECE